MALSTQLHEQHLFKSEDLADGVLQTITPNGLSLDGSVTAMPTSDVGPFSLCEKTFLFVVLDPFKSLVDADRSNNIVMIPIERDCSSFEKAEPICKVTPDYSVFGKLFKTWTWTNHISFPLEQN